MCEPVTIGLLAVSAASAVASQKAAADQAKAAGTDQNNRYNAVSSAALESYRRSTGRLQARAIEEIEAASATSVDNQRQAQTARGIASASGAARGVSGASVDELIGSYSAIEAANDYTIKRNLGFTLDQIREEQYGARADAVGRINGAAPSTIKGPSNLAFGLNLAAAGLQSYGNYQKAQPPK